MSDENQYQESSEDSSIASCSSFDLGEEEEEEEEVASSSTMNSFSSSSSSSAISLSNSDGIGHGPLYELSDLMAQLPIKRGLSKFYDGKSQSFTSLASVKSKEDLVKKDYSHCKKKLKTCKTDGEGILENHRKSHISPKSKASIAKKTTQGTRGNFLANSTMGKRGTASISNNRPPPIPDLKTF